MDQQLIRTRWARRVTARHNRRLTFAALLLLALCHISFAQAPRGSASAARQFSDKDIQAWRKPVSAHLQLASTSPPSGTTPSC